MSSKSSTPSPTTSKKTLTQATLTGVGNLIKLLPTGTVFVFQFLNPVLTNNGQCHVVNKYLSAILIAACGLSCFFASFTDGYTDNQGNIHYGIATRTGLCLGSGASSGQDLSAYRLRPGDFVHAFFALIVFGVVALLHPDSVECFYPTLGSTQRALLMALPPVIGVVSSSMFVLFPDNRHGIGYPSGPDYTRASTSA